MTLLIGHMYVFVKNKLRKAVAFAYFVFLVISNELATDSCDVKKYSNLRLEENYRLRIIQFRMPTTVNTTKLIQIFKHKTKQTYLFNYAIITRLN